MIQKNVGTNEAYLRTAVAAVLVLLALFLVDGPVMRIVLAVLAAILAGSAFIRTCPINHLLGRNTYDGDHSSTSPTKGPATAVNDAPAEASKTD
jgi:hypothetical protein